MKNSILLVAILLFMFISCRQKEEVNNSSKDNISLRKLSNDKQLNITILLDLSDRLVQDLTPPAKDRDLEIVKTIVGLFKKEMEKKGAFNSKGKIRVLFNPAPSDPKINDIAQDLKYDLSNIEVKQKKHVFDTMDSSFQANLTAIYDVTLATKNWVGSDIWRFFKNDVKDYCIDKSAEYRNILVILTDGYIYHEQSMDRVENRTSYITGNYLEQEGFRNSNWKEKFRNGNYGLITNSTGLQNLEVLVMEINPSSVHKDDEDIIKAYLNKWFSEMGILKYKIYNTDLPSNTSERIVNFFYQ